MAAFFLCASWLTSNAGTATVTIGASPSANVTGYRVYVATGTGPFVLAGTDGLVMTLNNLDGTQTLRFYATAYNDAGESPLSIIVTNQPVTPPIPPILSLTPPTLSTGTNQIVGQTVQITATVRNAGGGDLTLSGGALTLLPPGGTPADGPYIQVATMPAQVIRGGTSVSVGGPWIVNSITGQWIAYMAVKDATGTWVAGPQTVFTVRDTTPTPQPPQAPSGLQVSPVTTTRLDLQWSGTQTASTEIERNEQNSGFKLRATIGPGNLHYSDSIRRRRDYAYRVRARNSAGVSGFSNIATYDAP